MRHEKIVKREFYFCNANVILFFALSTSVLINHLKISDLKTQILNNVEDKKVSIDTVFIPQIIPIEKPKAKKIKKMKPMVPLEESLMTAGVDVRATVYNAVVEQCDSDPSHTAFMFKLDLEDPFKHRIIAVSRDLEKDFPNNTKVRVVGTTYDGIYTVKDRMHLRCRRQIDILINQDMPIGNWYGAKIYKI